MATIKTISVKKEFAEQAQKYGLSWSRAASVGMDIQLAELGLKDYDQTLNLVRKLNILTNLLNEKTKELESLKR